MSLSDEQKTKAQLIAELEALRVEVVQLRQSSIDPPELDLRGSAASLLRHGRQAEDILREQQLQLALEAARMGTWELDLKTQKLTWSRSLERLFELEPGTFDGRQETFISFLHPDDRDRVLEETNLAIQNQDGSHPTTEFRCVLPSGRIRWASVTSQIFYDEMGNPTRLVGVDLDITERKQAEEALQQQIEWQRLVMGMAQRIRQSLNLNEILQTTVEEVRQFLQTDRVIIFQFDSTWKGKVVVESVGAECMSILSTIIHDPCFEERYVEPFRQGLITAKEDIYTGDLDPCYIELLTQFQVRANLVVPILQGEKLWGLLIAHHCVSPRQWQSVEIDLLQQLATQVGIAIQQSTLFKQLKVELIDRQHTEAALRESEERWQLAIAGSNDGIWDYDLKTRQGVLSDRCQEILGYPEDDINTVDKWASLIHPDDVEITVGAFHAHLRNETPFYQMEYRIRRPDGRYRWLLIRGQALWDETGAPMRMVGSLTDIHDRKQAEAKIRSLNAELEQRVQERTAQLTIVNQELATKITERKQIEEALRQSEEKFRELAENIQAVFWMSNPKTQQLIYISPAYETVWGRRCEDLYRNFNEWIEAIHPMERDRIAQSAFDNVPAGQYDEEYRIVRPDGTIRWIRDRGFPVQDASGEMCRVAGIAEDITERKQAEIALSEAERRWRSLLENVRLVVVSLDATGRIEFVNPFFLEVTGYTQAEVLGKEWFDMFLPADETPQIRTVFEEFLQKDFHPYHQNAIVTKFGEERMIAWNNTLLRNVQGDMIGTISIGEDITQRHAVERLKDEFISIVSHELRTPLTSIRGSLGLLATGILNDEPNQMQRMIEIAATDTERLVRLVNDILDLEKLGSGKVTLVKESCQVTDLIQQSIEVMQASAQEAQVTLAIVPSSVQVWVAPDRLIQTLTNLLSNAIKFSVPGSQVWIGAEQRASIAGKTEVLFQVKDQGRGIPPDKIDTIFGRFQQVDASDSRLKGGTGLGLAICQTIVQQHGGRIWVESILGQGSTFFFTLPAAPDHLINREFPAS